MGRRCAGRQQPIPVPYQFRTYVCTYAHTLPTVVAPAIPSPPHYAPMMHMSSPPASQSTGQGSPFLGHAEKERERAAAQTQRDCAFARLSGQRKSPQFTSFLGQCPTRGEDLQGVRTVEHAPVLHRVRGRISKARRGSAATGQPAPALVSQVSLLRRLFAVAVCGKPPPAAPRKKPGGTIAMRATDRSRE